MLRFLNHEDGFEEWKALVGDADPHFLPEYYAAFGGGCLAVYDDKLCHPFRNQGDGWIGNAYNFGGFLGDTSLVNEFSVEFDVWKEANSLNERCTLNPYFVGCVPNRVYTSDKEVINIDLTGPIQYRQTTRHCIEKAAVKGACTTRVKPVQSTAELFWKAYDRSMYMKGAEKHWFYDKDFFFRVLRALGDNRSALFKTTVEGEIVNWCLVVFDKRTCYYHWAARTETSLISTSHFQVDAIRQWATENGMQNLCLGGGLTSSDNLFTFKSGFSKDRRVCTQYTTLGGWEVRQRGVA